MGRSKNLVINFTINAVIFYLIGRKLRGHGTGVKLGVAGGLVSALVAGRMDNPSRETIEDE